MSKKDEQKAKTAANGGGKSRMKVFVAGFDMEGSDETMAEGFKAIREFAASISRNTMFATTPPSQQALPPAKSDKHAPAVATEMSEKVVEVDGEGPETSEEVEETPSNGNGAAPKRTYNFKTPRFLNELDVNKAKKPLKDFVAEKNPSDVITKYLVVVYWLQKYMDVAEVTVDHIYTVFDILSWKTEMPLKVGKPLADLKSKRHMLTREAGAEGYKLNFKGEQEVEKMGAGK